MSTAKTVSFDAKGMTIEFEPDPVQKIFVPFRGATVQVWRGSKVRLRTMVGDHIEIDPEKLDTPSGYTATQLYEFIRDGLEA